MRLLFLGDMVGRSGRTAVWEQLPGLISDFKLDFVIVNGENAAGGFGITEEIFRETIDCRRRRGHHRQSCLGPARGAGLRAARASASCGPPISRKARRAAAPASFSRRTAPACWSPTSWAACSCIPNSTIRSMRRARTGGLSARRAGRRGGLRFPRRGDVARKMCFAHFVDGRASFVVGTHTHQPTADHQILNGGTGYMSDAGMCGDYDSSLGMDKEEPLNRFLSKVPKGRFEAADGPGDDLRRRRRDFRPHRACREDRAAFGSGRGWKKPCRRSGHDVDDRRRANLSRARTSDTIRATSLRNDPHGMR